MPRYLHWHLLSCLALAGCDGAAPKGQVIAVVNGEEITVSELNYEARVRNLRVEDDPALRSALVRELVDRRLLVGQGSASGVDRTPEFILAERRLRDILLAQQLIGQAGDQRPASAADVRAFVAGNPRIFSERVAADVTVIRLPAVDAALRSRIGAASSRTEVASILAGARIAARPTRETWDSADPTNPLAAGKVAPVLDRPFLFERDGGLFAGTIDRLSATPVPAEQQEPLARALINREASANRMNALLADARESATIHLQPGF